MHFLRHVCDAAAISIPFICNQGDCYSIEQETELWELIARILENDRLPKIGQNISFDAHFLLRRYGIRTRNLNDTMVAQQILMGDYPKGLDFITSIWTDHPYYKDEGKRWFKVGGAWEQLWQYNATDSIICAEAFPKQTEALIQQRNVATYERQRQVIEPLIYMQERGIRVDIEGIRRKADALLSEAAELQQELNRVAGEPLNPNSPKQLKDFFYIKRGFKPYVKKGGGGLTVDKMALKRLARKGATEAKLILEMRRRLKLASTYLDLDKIDADGRCRCSYNPVGTRYSRLSSSSSIFGTGMNMQNIPHEILQYFLPDEGYVYYAYDLSQAENRIVAYVGNIPEMIDAFESGKDVHRLTASLIFKKPYDAISDEEGSSPFGDGKSERDWGKRANHGLNYDLGYRSFALYYEMPETDSKFIVESYHRAYPGVRQNYHAYVRQCLRENRFVTNLMGRRTLFLGAWEDSLFKEAYSCIPQGTTGDVVNERGINFAYYNQRQFGPLELLVQVHDSIGFQIPLSVPWIEHARMLQAIKTSLETPLRTHFGREFVIPVDLMMGLTMNKRTGRELKHKKWPGTLEELATQLEANYAEISAPSKG
jgi:DNA polymerase-1